MVEMDDAGRVVGLRIKQPDIGLRYTWVIAVWSPAFTRFMHEYLDHLIRSKEATEREFHVGDVIQAAIDAGLRIDSVIFPQGRCVDIGAPDMLEQLHQGKLMLP
jgi:glucose-1-phosphate thymidylyltransferase